MDVYSDMSYHLLASFGWKIYHSVEGSKFNVMDVTDLFPSHVQRGFDKEKIVYSYVIIVSQLVLMRRYQFLVPYLRCMIWWGGVYGIMSCKVSRHQTCSPVVSTLRTNYSVLLGQILVSRSGTDTRYWRSDTERRKLARMERSGDRNHILGRSRTKRHRVAMGIKERHREGWIRKVSIY